MLFWKVSFLLSSASTAAAKLAWGETKFLFTFGDSYTDDGFNISAGVNSPTPGWVGICWTVISEVLTPSNGRIDFVQWS